MKTLTLSLFAWLVIFGAAIESAVAQEPTAYIGDELEGLTEALGKDPQNIGLRMRIVRRVLKLVEESTDISEGKRLLKIVSDQVDGIYKLEPDFIYVYRVLALQHYRRREYSEFMDVMAKYSKVADLDFEMKSTYVKNLLRMATDPDKPEPGRKKEAALYVGDWFDSGAAPLFSDTLGTTAAWLFDVEFRDELLTIFKDRYEKEPENLNLAISYAACLYAIGRNERAWNLVHDAETRGLCDDVTGGRHALVNLLQWQAPELETPQTYNGSDIEELTSLSQKFPKNASFLMRMALINKRKAVAAKRVAAVLLERAEKYKDDSERQEFVRRCREQSAEGRKRTKEYYRTALENAKAALELNPKIESIPLLLADIYANLDEKQKAVEFLRRSVEAVPFLSRLRVKLAELHVDLGQWNEAAKQMAVVLRLVGCRALDWDEEPTDSLLPKPAADNAREQLVVRFARDARGRKALETALQAAIRVHPKNPNLKVNLAMLHYFANNRSGAVAAMLGAERDGMCGSDGFEHHLATLIYSRERW